MVICTIDHTDGDLHNDQQMVICLKIKQNYFVIEIYIWEHLELKLRLKSELKLSNMYAYGKHISLHFQVIFLYQYL